MRYSGAVERALNRLMIFSVLEILLIILTTILLSSRISIWFSAINSHILVPVQKTHDMKTIYLTPYLAITTSSMETLELFTTILAITIIIGLIAVLKYALPTFILLREHYREKFDKITLLVKSGVLGVIISLPVMIISGCIGSLIVPQMFIICIVSFLILILSIFLIGIGFLLGVMKLRDVTDENMFKISVIINVIGIVISIVYLYVGAILQILSLIILCLACLRFLKKSKLSGTPTHHHYFQFR